MSSLPHSPLPLAKKRPLSLENDAEPQAIERYAKKSRVDDPSTATPLSRQDKKRRRKKKRSFSVVESKLVRGTTSLNETHSNASTQVDSKPEDHVGGAAIKLDGPVASSSHPTAEDLSFVPVVKRSSSSMKVQNLLSPVETSSPLTPKNERNVNSPTSSSTSSPLPNQVAELESQIAQLQIQLASRREELDKRSDLLSNFQQSLMCQVCIDLMYKPYAISPCGHLVCYDCLVRWFKTPASDPSLESNDPIRKRKTCPHCRAVVRVRPIEVYGVKDMVNALAKSGLAVGLPSRDNNVINHEESASDPWEGIFPKKSARDNHLAHIWPLNEQNLSLNHLDTDDGYDHAAVGFPGLYDGQDGVYRCVDCLHEIWDGACSDCGREYTRFPEPIDLDELDALEAEERAGNPHNHSSDPTGFVQAFMNQAMQLGMMLYHPPTPGGLSGDDNDTIEDGNDALIDLDDDEYESSFIDDDDGVGDVDDLVSVRDDSSSPVRPRPRRTVRSEAGRHRNVIMLSSDDESGGPTSSSGPRTRRSGRIPTNSNVRRIRSPPSRTRSRQQSSVGSEDVIARTPNSSDTRVSRFNNPLGWLGSDEEASGEDHEDGEDGGGHDSNIEEDDGPIPHHPIHIMRFAEPIIFVESGSDEGEGVYLQSSDER